MMRPQTLKTLGIIVSGLTVVLALAGSDVNANGVSTGANPLASVGLGLAAIALMMGARLP